MRQPFLTLLLIFGFCSGAFAQQLPNPNCQMVIFTPSDVKPPPEKDYQERLQQFGECAEEFFNNELKRSGYEPAKKEIFNRGQDGKITVVHVKSDFPFKDKAYAKEWISRQTHSKLKSEHGLKTAGNMYWIFVYVGDPPKAHTNFKGAGNSRDGGWGVVNYANVPTKISKTKDLVSTAHNKVFLKGCIHEFGHGFGLPHIGPKVELKLGNTLMGPITKIYVKNKMPRKTKACLSAGSAAILSAHPVFTGSTKGRGDLPKTIFDETKVEVDQAEKAIVVTGKLKPTTQKVHRVVVLDDRDDKIGEYWVRSFVSELDEQAQFRVSIPNPNRSGKIKIFVVYENGAVTGDGKKRGLDSARVIPYSFR